MKKILLLIPVITLCMMLSGYRSPAAPQETLRSLTESADSGDTHALYRLALLYESGFDTIPADSLRALDYLRRAAEGGFMPAQNYLGYLCINSGHPAEGFGWIERAALGGDPKAQSNIGFMLLDGTIVEKDEEKAAFWLQRSADEGVATAASMLGDLYRDGRGVEQDSLQAALLYKEALEVGLKDAAYKLEDLMKETWSRMPAEEQLRLSLYFYPSRAPEVAIPILQRIAAKDTGKTGAKAAALLGDAYTRGIGVGYDHEKSLEFYWEAARKGDPSAEFVIAELLEIFPDALETLTSAPPAAAELRQQAARHGVSSAEEATLMLFKPDIGIDPDVEDTNGNTDIEITPARQ